MTSHSLSVLPASGSAVPERPERAKAPPFRRESTAAGEPRPLPTIEDVRAAARRLEGVAVRTPLIGSPKADERPTTLCANKRNPSAMSVGCRNNAGTNTRA